MRLVPLLVCLVFLLTLGSVLCDTTPLACNANGACTVDAPICSEGNDYFFTCDQTTGTWVSDYTVINQSMVIGGPVLFINGLELIDDANLTFTSNHSAFLQIYGVANFTGANSTWLVQVSQADIDAYTAIESADSTNYTDSKRQIFIAETVMQNPDWNIQVSSPLTCHTVFLVNNTPNLYTGIGGYGSHVFAGNTFNLFFYTHSECWYWIILVGSIVFYMIVIIVVIVMFKAVPSLRQWTTAPPVTASTTNAPRLLNEDEYEMDSAPRHRKAGNSRADRVDLDDQ